MSWFSILPQSIAFIESWLIRIFLVLGALVIGPWLLLILYDFILFLVRTTMYDIPVIGGRARNRPRPRAPSLSERPSGRPRSFSVALPDLASSQETAEETLEGLKQRVKRPGHTSNSSNVLVDE